ncbi:hypothetical protein FAGAP_7534 [Fusarium agapanthi]|uniref:Uncharacterized protein n=1 Tax=Fusarium agapanthi TaxID=1803897 RepID=A0A9P5BCW3_9HYPO|nr:hypothetical protein FAGAP_7534 [Fusarium agapanthi]
MARFSLYQLSTASRRLSLSLLRQHQNKLAVSKRQPSPIRLLSLQQPRYIHTGDDAKSDESTQISSDIAAAEEGIKAHSSVETSNEAKSIVDDSIQSSNDVTGDQDVGDSDAPIPDLGPILSSDPRGEAKIKARPWGEEELAQLEEFVKRPYFSVDYIARRMDRYYSSVLDQLKQMEEQKGVELLRRSRSKTPWHHNMDATPEQVAIFEAKQDDVQKRMEHIVEILMTLPKTSQWEEILEMKSASEWASAIMKLIPLRVWHILAADNPPSEREYATIPMVDPFSTTGVFAQVYRRRLYIGYIDAPFGVLARRYQGPNSDRHRGLKVPLVPVSLEMSKQLTYEETVEQRYVLGLARAALAAWLGAFHYESSPTLRELYAWWEKDVDSSLHRFGTMSCNPLEQKLILPPTPEESAAKKAKLEEELKREAEKAGETEKEVKKRLWRESAKKRASEAKGEF